jgi:hypothetical protein
MAYKPNGGFNSLRVKWPATRLKGCNGKRYRTNGSSEPTYNLHTIYNFEFFSLSCRPLSRYLLDKLFLFKDIYIVDFELY